MRILYMGTPDFAAASLERIAQDGHTLCGVFTQPDKPRGRKFKLCPPPVKAEAQKLGVPVFQPATLRDDSVVEQIRGLSPQVIVVAAYGKILPEAVLSIPPLGCVNVHASLLPRYRGAAPIQWAIINGEAQTGITTMFMSKGIDTGDIILKRPLEIGGDETFGELQDRLTVLGAQTLSETLRLVEQGKAPREKQDDSKSCYASMIELDTTILDFCRPARKVHDLIRGLSPAPGARTTLRGKTFKVLGSRLGGAAAVKPGEVCSAGGEGIGVCCGDGNSVVFTLVQEQGGKRMAASVYLHGHPVKPGEVFGR